MLIDESVNIKEQHEESKIKRGQGLMQNEKVEIIKEAPRKQLGGKSIRKL